MDQTSPFHLSIPSRLAQPPLAPLALTLQLHILPFQKNDEIPTPKRIPYPFCYIDPRSHFGPLDLNAILSRWKLALDGFSMVNGRWKIAIIKKKGRFERLIYGKSVVLTTFPLIKVTSSRIFTALDEN